MRDVKYIKEVRSKIKEKLDKINERLDEMRMNKGYAQDKDFVRLYGLKTRYIDYVSALNFVLNEDSKLHNFNSKYNEGLEEFLFEIDE
jgi:trans-2-enoyl-CoA reductase